MYAFWFLYFLIFPWNNHVYPYLLKSAWWQNRRLKIIDMWPELTFQKFLNFCFMNLFLIMWKTVSRKAAFDKLNHSLRLTELMKFVFSIDLVEYFGCVIFTHHCLRSSTGFCVGFSFLKCLYKWYCWRCLSILCWQFTRSIIISPLNWYLMFVLM